MHVLVVVASRHGSTLEVAQAIAEELRGAGQEVDLRAADEVASLDPYQAVVLGSAVYVGNWLPEARRFVEQHGAQLETRPVWLFSSGPLGAEDPKPAGDPTRLPELMQATRARDHRIFAGRLDRHELGLGERIVTRAVGAPEGDFRDWEAIRGWARQIAASLDGKRQPEA